MASTTLVEQRKLSAALELTDIDRTLVDLRREREAQLKQLRELEIAAEGSDDPTVFLDIAELRAELRALLDHWRSVLTLALTNNNWPLLGKKTPEFAGKLKGNQWCQARARVPLTPDSMLFVHGPVTLWHAAALAETMLDDGDRLTCLISCAFRRELVYEPQIAVWDESFSSTPHGFAREDIAVDGVFKTASGRSLAFAAVPDCEHVPLTRAGWHPLTSALIALGKQCDRQAEPATIEQRLGLDLWACPPETKRASDILLAKAEALLAGMTQNMMVGDRIMLLARASNFTIDEDFAAWLAQNPTLQYEFNWDRQKPIPGRGSFIPFRYRVSPDTEGWQRSMFICLDSHMGL